MQQTYFPFIDAITEIADDIHANAKAKGFWAVTTYDADALEKAFNEEPKSYTLALIKDMTQPDNQSEKLMLIVSELAEAQEALRHGNPAGEHIPEFSAVEEELADAVIRILDLCGRYGYRIGEAIVAKHAYNKTRSHKHGKSF